VEQNMLIAMIMRQISLICGKTANCYKAMHLHNSTSNTNSSSRQQSELDGSIGIDILVSSYRVTRQEMLHLLEGLVTLQIGEFQHHLNTFKERYRNRPKQGQTEALREAEASIKLAQSVISSCT
jgi:hypothetical protein